MLARLVGHVDLRGSLVDLNYFIITNVMSAFPHNAQTILLLPSQRYLLHHHHQFIGSKTRQSNTCNKTNRAGQQEH